MTEHKFRREFDDKVLYEIHNGKHGWKAALELSDCYAHIERVESLLEKAVEMAGWYGNQTKYMLFPAKNPKSLVTGEILEDFGERAREFLEEVGK